MQKYKTTGNLPLPYEVLHQMIRHYLNGEITNWDTLTRARAANKKGFWEQYRSRRRNFIFTFNDCIYTAPGKVMVRDVTERQRRTGGDSPPTIVREITLRPYTNSQAQVEICSAYSDVDMLALHGVYGDGLQTRAAYDTNYGERSIDPAEVKVRVGGQELLFRRGDVGIAYGPPNAGKNKLWDNIAEAMSTQNLRVLLVPGFETRRMGVKSIAAWLQNMDRAAEEADVIIADGITDLAVLGQEAKSTQGNDNEHGISLPRWFSGLAKEGKIVVAIINSLDLSNPAALQARRRMYTGKFSFVTYSGGKEDNWSHTFERGSGFGIRQSISLALSSQEISLTKSVTEYGSDHQVDSAIRDEIEDNEEREDKTEKPLHPVRANQGSIDPDDFGLED